MKRIALIAVIMVSLASTAGAAPIGYWLEQWILPNTGPGQPGDLLQGANYLSFPLLGSPPLTFDFGAALTGFTAPPQNLAGGVTRYTTHYGSFSGSTAFLELFSGNPWGGTPGLYNDSFDLTVIADIGPTGTYLGGHAFGSASSNTLGTISVDVLLNELDLLYSAATEGVIGHYGEINSVPVSVPEPASLLLLGTGLAGLVRWRRRRT